MRYQARHNVLLYTDIDHAEYVECNGSLYRDNWLNPTSTLKIPYIEVNIVSIDEDEYEALFEAFETKEEVEIEAEENPTDERIGGDEDLSDESLEFVREMKIISMSNMCNLAIVNGVDITLSDDVSHHFSLDLTDQLNLLTLSSMIAAGETQIPYHADGEACKYYSAEDISAIVQAATAFKAYHTTYYNSLKSYINSLDSIEDIRNIYYGIEIPADYQSEILRDMLNA